MNLRESFGKSWDNKQWIGFFGGYVDLDPDRVSCFHLL